jgi:hypothetical protein
VKAIARLRLDEPGRRAGGLSADAPGWSQHLVIMSRTLEGF